MNRLDKALQSKKELQEKIHNSINDFHKDNPGMLIDEIDISFKDIRTEDGTITRSSIVEVKIYVDKDILFDELFDHYDPQTVEAYYENVLKRISIDGLR